MTTNRPLPIGTPVALLTDVFGDQAVTGTIAGHCTYAHPTTPAIVEYGYAVHLDQGFFAPYGTNIGSQPWIGTIVVHVESVAQVPPRAERERMTTGEFLDGLAAGGSTNMVDDR